MSLDNDLSKPQTCLSEDHAEETQQHMDFLSALKVKHFSEKSTW